MRKNEKQKGSITVEATLFLPLFLFAFLSIYNLIYFARAQLLIQYAVNQASMEVSEYSYILERAGILDAMDKTSGTADSLSKDLQDLQTNLGVIQKAAQNASQGNDVINQAMEIGEASEAIYDNVSQYVNDPQKFISGVIAAVKTNVKDGLSTYMISTVAKASFQKQLCIASGGMQWQDYLDKLGVTNVRFDQSKWCQNKSRDVKIIVDYDIASQLPFFSMKARHYRVCASTRVWAGS